MYLITHLQFASNNGYTYEVSAHWISSYFLGDKMRLPSSAEEAIAIAQLNAAWIRKRFPGMLLWVNESESSSICLWEYVLMTSFVISTDDTPRIQLATIQ
jgi:dimethylaniline monooxygenase (N-oxide forming)